MLKKGEVKMIHKMKKQGLSKSAIARKLDLSRDTVAKYAKLPEGHIPVIKRVSSGTIVDAYFSTTGDNNEVQGSLLLLVIVHQLCIF